MIRFGDGCDGDVDMAHISDIIQIFMAANSKEIKFIAKTSFIRRWKILKI